jgi:phage-related protein
MLYFLHEVGQRISTKTPPKELALARKRMKEWKDADS